MSENKLVEQYVLNRIEKDPFYFDAQGLVDSLEQILRRMWLRVRQLVSPSLVATQHESSI